MAFFPPIPLIRRNVIVNSLRDCGATSEATARTLAEAGVINPNGFKLMICDKDNIGSAKSIINNGGILENEFINSNGEIEQRYWITI